MQALPRARASSLAHGLLHRYGLGDVTNNLNSPGVDDFSVYFENNGAFLLSQVVVIKKDSGFFGSDFRFNDATSGAFSVSVAPPQAVPDFASTALLGTLGGLGLMTFRRRVASRIQRGL